MKKIDWKTLIITVLVCFIPIVIGVIFYNKMPDEMAMHFGMNNKPDVYASKNFVLFLIPVIMILLQVFCCVISDINGAKKKNSPKVIGIVKWIVPVLSIVIYITMIVYSLGYDLDIRRIICTVIGLIFMILGNYMPKMSFEDATNIMYPKPKDAKKFMSVSKVIGYTFVVLGLLLIISVVLKPMYSYGVLILTAVITIIEAIYFIFKK